MKDELKEAFDRVKNSIPTHSSKWREAILKDLELLYKKAKKEDTNNVVLAE